MDFLQFTERFGLPVAMLLFALITGAMNKWEFTSSSSKREAQLKERIEQQDAEHAAEIARLERNYEAWRKERDAQYEARLKERDLQLRRLLEVNEKQVPVLQETAGSVRSLMEGQRAQTDQLRRIELACNPQMPEREKGGGQRGQPPRSEPQGGSG